MIRLFWFFFGTLIYIYFVYPVVVRVLARLFGAKPKKQPITPHVTLLIPAFNEEAHMPMKMENSLKLDYPRDRLEIVVSNDGSTDATESIARRFADRGVRMISMPENVGKANMLARVVPELSSEIVVFSDVSSELEPDALRMLVQNFADPRVGCVSGLYRLKPAGDLRGQGEGLYWKYETFIKEQESRLHSILGAHGAFYGVRRELFQALGRMSINDDYLIPMRIVQGGHRAVYEPKAVAWELELASVSGEFARRRRIAVGNCQQIVELGHMLSPKYGWVSFCFFSHKVLRTLAPLVMMGVFVTSWWLPSGWLRLGLGVQTLFYGSAYAGYLCQRLGRSVRWLSLPMYFCLGNLAMLEGILKYLFNRKAVKWERAR